MTWKQKEHAEKWMLFPHNLGKYLSIDEVSISNGELYTVITNKQAHGKKGALIAIIDGTKVRDIVAVLEKVSLLSRVCVTEVTLDMAANMEAAMREVFPYARITTDRFHVQQLISESIQELRIEKRREAIHEENEQIKEARKNKKRYTSPIYENGDTKKQLLARSRHLLFKSKKKWTKRQTARAEILFKVFPEIRHAYNLSMMFRSIYERSKTIEEAQERLHNWYEKVAQERNETFSVSAESVRLHETTILNYFIDRSTNASAESFNAKLKNFRALVRGVRDKQFHLFRIAKLYG